MSNYLIGDIHGYFTELQSLLKKVNFNPKFDTLWLTGDLVARGPLSLDVLRYVKSLGSSSKMVLGNHDLNLISEFFGISFGNNRNYLNPFFNSNDSYELINWLRKQPLIQIDEEKKIIMTHAGITPQWDIETIKRCAKELEDILSSDKYLSFLKNMYGNTPYSWSENLCGHLRLRFISNALTRMRYCFPNGQLQLPYKEPEIGTKLKPWFDIPNSSIEKYTIIFGHWSALRGLGTPDKILALDTGCCWGGKLTLLCWESKIKITQDCKKPN